MRLLLSLLCPRPELRALSSLLSPRLLLVPPLLALPAILLLPGQPYVFPAACPKREEPNKPLEFRATG